MRKRAGGGTAWLDAVIHCSQNSCEKLPADVYGGSKATEKQHVAGIGHSVTVPACKSHFRRDWGS